MSPRPVAAAAEWLAERPHETGLFTDFDGTLSPIVARPDDARPVPGVNDALHRLSRRLGVVAVVSGRPVGFLIDRVAVDGAHLYGLHGLEQALVPGAIEVVPEAVPWQRAVAEAVVEAGAEAPAGVEVEDKGFGLTLHWRNAGDVVSVRGAAEDVAEHVARRHGLLLRPGRASVELVPPIGINKGSVVTSWAARLRRLAFIGDDMGDLLAFEALDKLRADGRHETLKIAVASDEAPRDLAERADIVLDAPSAVLALLEGLADLLG